MNDNGNAVFLTSIRRLSLPISNSVYTRSNVAISTKSVGLSGQLSNLSESLDVLSRGTHRFGSPSD